MRSGVSFARGSSKETTGRKPSPTGKSLGNRAEVGAHKTVLVQIAPKLAAEALLAMGSPCAMTKFGTIR
jgi:hypothetical protein